MLIKSQSKLHLHTRCSTALKKLVILTTVQLVTTEEGLTLPCINEHAVTNMILLLLAVTTEHL